MIVGFTCGAFDLLHAGHVSMFQFCKEHCDYLVVGLHTDPTIDRPMKNKPIQTSFERYVQLAGIRFVDQVIPYDTEKDLCNMLATMSDLKIRFVGEDYRGTRITGQDICELNKIKIMHTPRYHTYSSSELRERVYTDVVQRSVL